MRSNVLQIVGYKNSGKTTLLCKLVAHFSSLGWKVATLKHDAHAFEMDRPHTDTWKHRQAGAWLTGITSPGETAWLREGETQLEAMLVEAHGADLILVEGFKHAPYPKLVLLRTAADLDLLEQCSEVIAVYSQELDMLLSMDEDMRLPRRFHSGSSVEEIAQYVHSRGVIPLHSPKE